MNPFAIAAVWVILLVLALLFFGYYILIALLTGDTPSEFPASLMWNVFILLLPIAIIGVFAQLFHQWKHKRIKWPFVVALLLLIPYTVWGYIDMQPGP